MSTGHLRGEVKSDAELYKALGQGDTPEKYGKPVTVDTSHTIAYGGGVSVDGKTVYIDRDLHREVMDGQVKARGMSPRQIIQAWIEHEHSEFSIDIGDNAVDVYQPCHELATAKEHKFVRQLGVDADRYESDIRPGLLRALQRPQTNPPKDLWCGPYLDHADKHDKEILRQFRAKGVDDAFKVSKFDVHYGYGENQCKDCVMFGKTGGALRPCEKISGLVRATRWCDLWSPRKES